MAAKRHKQLSRQNGFTQMDDVPLQNIPDFASIALTQAQIEDFERVAAQEAAQLQVGVDEFQLGCIVSLDRGYPAVLTKQGVIRVEFSAALSKQKTPVALGDWVVVRKPHHDLDGALLMGICRREETLARWKGSSRGSKQLLAANLASVLIVQPLDRELILDRIVRSIVVSLDAKCKPYVVLTKADTVSKLRGSELLDTLLKTIPEGIEVYVVSIKDELLTWDFVSTRVHFGMQSVFTILPPKETALLLGESGAGKSSLVNALLKSETVKTGEVRKKDKQGRHTTVARRMIGLSNGGSIVDVPGLRTLPLLGHEHGLELAFPAITKLSNQCKFRDCTHVHEPSCAVLAALKDGVLTYERYAIYQKLLQEMRASVREIDPDISL